MVQRFAIWIFLLLSAATAWAGQGRLTGSVRDELGHPVNGAKVSIVTVDSGGSGAASRTVTDGEGHFELTLTDAQGMLVVSAPGFLPVRKQVKAEANLNGLQVVLEKAARLSGQLRAKRDGSPLGGTVRVLQAEPSVRAWTVAVGADGRFFVDHLSSGGVELVATAPGFSAERVVSAVLPGELTTVEMLLKRPATISGEVRFGDGKPAAGTNVRIQVDDTPSTVLGRPRWTPAVGWHKTRPDGTFSITGPPDTGIYLEIEHATCGVRRRIPLSLEEGAHEQLGPLVLEGCRPE